MPPPPVGNWYRTCAVGIAGLLALAVWAGEARAGCGDHVVILSKNETPNRDSGDPPAAPKPCDGPNCSLNQLPPVPPPSAPVVAKPLPPDALFAEDAAADPAAFAPLGADLISLPADRPADVFRPPRAG